ncbi:MAG TPA: aminotransferase class I/II-fold pyridoxal phosphate-dependent enzyme [Streptosporangiaceae bacterium]|nr:aminotransferase class I/II-fold pyridoxal phosphate-dependent enzyme [Streptosporangiaceae bacterium]
MDPVLGDCSLASLRKRTSHKWRTYPPDVLPAFVAEMDFDPAAEIKDAIRAALDAGDLGYPHKGEMGEAFAEFAADRLGGWSPDPDLVFAIPDVMTGIIEVVQALVPAGGGVVINPPVYSPFFFRLELAGRRVVEAPLAAGPDGSYDLDLEAIDRALTLPGTGAYLLCNPHNPVGRVWSAEQLTAVAGLCDRRGVPLLVDEIHAPLVLPGATHVPFHTLDHPAARRAVIFTSATKGWNIPGVKCGLAVAGDTESATILGLRWDALLASHLGVHATVAALRHGRSWLDAVVAQIDQNARLLGDLLAHYLPGVRYRRPQASFLAWLDCRDIGLGADPAAAFLGAGRVALSPGPDFGSQGSGFARLNIGTSPELVAEAVRRMAAALPGERAGRG